MRNDVDSMWTAPMLEKLIPMHRLALLPDRWVLSPAGGKAQLVAEFDANAYDVAAVLLALEGLLGRHAVKGRLRVTLSHHQVRLFLADAPPVWLQRDEMQAWLANALAPALAEADQAHGWRLTWDLTPPGKPIVVAALPESVLLGIETVCRQHGVKLVGVRPWLAEAWQRRQRQLGRSSGWYAVLEPGRQVLLRLQGGQVTALRQRQSGADAGAELDALLTREALLADLPAGGDLWLERAGVKPDLSGLAGRYNVHELAGPLELAQALLS